MPRKEPRPRAYTLDEIRTVAAKTYRDTPAPKWVATLCERLAADAPVEYVPRKLTPEEEERIKRNVDAALRRRCLLK